MKKKKASKRPQGLVNPGESRSSPLLLLLCPVALPWRVDLLATFTSHWVKETLLICLLHLCPAYMEFFWSTGAKTSVSGTGGNAGGRVPLYFQPISHSISSTQHPMSWFVNVVHTLLHGMLVHLDKISYGTESPRRGGFCFLLFP